MSDSNEAGFTPDGEPDSIHDASQSLESDNPSVSDPLDAELKDLV